MKGAVLLGVATQLLLQVIASCPNACSGHGECNVNDACDCHNGYTGSDCSARLCAFGLAFADAPRGDLNHDGQVSSGTYSQVQWSRYKEYESWPSSSASALTYDANGVITTAATIQGGWKAVADEAHFYSECSGKGLCDRELAKCNCYDGYTGSVCQRAVCPNDCSSHGVCRTVASIAAGGLKSRYLLSSGGYNYYEGSESPFEYRLWDADKNQACVCDAGYFGADCSQRECPRGADPLTPKCAGVNCVNEIQGFTLSSVGANAGKLYAIQFETPSGRSYTTSFFDPASADTIQAALQALPNSVTGDVTVNRGTDIAGNFRITVTFTSQTGNIPEFTVVKGPGAANVIAQPSEPVHTYSGVTFGSTDLATLYLFPEDQTGFRSTQFTGTSTVAAGATTTSAVTAIESAIAKTSALLNGFGTSVVVTGAGPYNVLIQFPSKRIGDVPSQLKFGTTTFYGSNDQRNGNTESRICSDRGLCDFSNGVCGCFPGYIGSACSQQSALAM